jgi:hypothetical protein
MKIAEKVLNLLRDESAVKVVTSISGEGKLHSVVAGSVMALGEDKLSVMEIFMNTTSDNLQANKDMAVLVVKGMESYLINATVIERITEGKLFGAYAKVMSEKGLPIKAVWTFDVDEMFDQSASPNAGSRIE